MSNTRTLAAPRRRPPASPRWEPLAGPLTFSMTPGPAGLPVMKRGAIAGCPHVEGWRNDQYFVVVRRRMDGTVESLEIAPTAADPPPWSDFQAIKDQLAGPETEAAHLHPARSRLASPEVNAYFLWVLPPGERYPFGIDHETVDPIMRAG